MRKVIIHSQTPDGYLWRYQTAEDELLEELWENDKHKEFKREQELADLTKEATCEAK